MKGKLYIQGVVLIFISLCVQVCVADVNVAKDIKKAAQKTGNGIKKAAHDTGKFFSKTFNQKTVIPSDCVILNNNTSQPIHIYQIPIAAIKSGEQHVRTIAAQKQSYRLKCDPRYIYTLKQSNKSLNQFKKGSMERLRRQKRNDYILLSPESEAKYPVLQHAFSCLDNGKQIIINNAQQGIKMARTYSVHTAQYKGNGSVDQVRAETMGLVTAAVFIASLAIIVLTVGVAAPGLLVFGETVQTYTISQGGAYVPIQVGVGASTITAAQVSTVIAASVAASGFATSAGIATGNLIKADQESLVKDAWDAVVLADKQVEGTGIVTVMDFKKNIACKPYAMVYLNGSSMDCSI